MSILPVTLLMAGVSALISIWLGLRVSLLRRRHKISVGDGANETVQARMRSHANFSEYAPIFLILLGSVELAIGSPDWLLLTAVLFIVGRLLHPFGMEQPAPNLPRIIGILTTWLVLAGLAAYAIAIAYADLQRPDITYAEAPRAST